MFNPDKLIGKHIDQFRLDRYLARGAMGIVYLAFDTVLSRNVALKLILNTMENGLSGEELVERQQARRRLLQEAKAAGRLCHPNIVTIHAYGETDEFVYICMEYVNGKTLSQLRQERKVLPLEVVIPIMEQILTAIEVANEENIVHRDIKPSNVMVTPDNRVKVLDFGLAKLTTPSMTLTNTVLGTPYYMSPEQITGEGTDIRSDIFSTAAVFYEMLTGERPFEAQNMTTVIYKIVNVEPAPVNVLNTHIPESIGKIVAKALSKNPAQRYQTPTEMLKDLRSLRANPKVQRRTPTQIRPLKAGSDLDRTIQTDGIDLGATKELLLAELTHLEEMAKEIVSGFTPSSADVRPIKPMTGTNTGKNEKAGETSGTSTPLSPMPLVPPSEAAPGESKTIAGSELPKVLPAKKRILPALSAGTDGSPAPQEAQGGKRSARSYVIALLCVLLLAALICALFVLR